jgi:hypothetical protein
MFGLTYAILGFIGGVIFCVTSLFTRTDPGALAFGIGAVIGFPLLYGVMGFIFGAVFAWIYNVVAKRVGGIEIETD